MAIYGIESISPLMATDSVARGQGIELGKKEPADFLAWLEKEVSTANQQIYDADMKLREYAVGQSDNLHEVMMSLEKAKTSFELVVEVRNRLLEGYQEIMRMQI